MLRRSGASPPWALVRRRRRQRARPAAVSRLDRLDAAVRRRRAHSRREGAAVLPRQPRAASRCKPLHSFPGCPSLRRMHGCARTRACRRRGLLRAHRGRSGDAVMAHDKGMERYLSIPLCGILHAGAAAARRAAAAHKAGGVALTTHLQLVARHVRRDRYSPSTPSSSVVSPGTPARPSRATPPTSAPGLGSPRPHLRRDWACPGPYLHCKQAQPGHICTGTGLTLPTSAPRLG